MVACEKERHDFVVGREALVTVLPHSVEILGTRMGGVGYLKKDILNIHIHSTYM